MNRKIQKVTAIFSSAAVLAFGGMKLDATAKTNKGGLEKLTVEFKGKYDNYFNNTVIKDSKYVRNILNGFDTASNYMNWAVKAYEVVAFSRETMTPFSLDLMNFRIRQALAETGKNYRDLDKNGSLSDKEVFKNLKEGTIRHHANNALTFFDTLQTRNFTNTRDVNKFAALAKEAASYATMLAGKNDMEDAEYKIFFPNHSSDKAKTFFGLVVEKAYTSAYEGKVNSNKIKDINFR